MMRTKGWVTALICALVAGEAAAEDVMPELVNFDQRPEQIAIGAKSSAQAMTPGAGDALAQLRTDPRVSELRVGWSAANAAIKAKGFTLSLRSTQAPVLIEELEVTSTNGTTHLYRYDTETGNETSIAVRGDDMLGRVKIGADTWRLTPLGGGRTAVFHYEIGTIRPHPRGWEDLMGEDVTPRWGGSAMRNLIEKHERSATDAPAQSTIDVLVAYTSSAKAAVRGADKRTSVDLALEAMFADTNRVFERSGIDTRLKLVHAAHVSYTQGANMVEDLCRLTARGETWGELRACKRAGVTRPEALDSLHKMRDRYEADLVTLIVGMNENRTAGIAWIAPDHEGFGFSVFSAEAELAGGYVFAHETGHNLGAGHNPGRATPGNGHPLRAYGHGRCNTEENWHTVMSYADNGPPEFKACGRNTRVPLLSSPDVAGPKETPTGDAHTHNVARLIEETTETVMRNRGHTFAHFLPFMPGTKMQEQGLSGFVRIVNASTRGGRIAITATDDAGNVERTTIWIQGFKARQFNSDDLEIGNRRGLKEGIGPGTGHRRLVFESDLSLAVLGYVLTHDGLLVSTDKTAETVDIAQGEVSGINFFNPGSVRNAQSVLRIINPRGTAIDVEIMGIDDQGQWGEETITFELGARRAVNITSRTLEDGPSFAEGALGNGAGKWTLLVVTAKHIEVMSLLLSQTGYVSNVSR